MCDTQMVSRSEHRGLLASANPPIHSLPDELLSLIFVYTVSYPVFALTHPREGWWSIPWVNRHFRRVALQTPRFWATPMFINEVLLNTMLARSGVAPLTVCFDDRAHGLLEQETDGDSLGLLLLRKALLHLSHIESLTIFGNRRTIEHSRHLLQGHSAAPLLRYFSINCYENWETLPPALQQEQPKVIAFSNDLFCGRAPRLQALTLHRSQLLWTSPLLGSSLLILVLTSPQYPRYAEAVLDALARMPHLHYLVLLPGPPSDDAQLIRPPLTPNVVTLPQMRQCMSDTILEDAAALLNTIVVPQNARMRMTCHAPSDMEDAAIVGPVAQGLARWYEQQRPVMPSARLLALRVQAYTTSHWDNLRITTGWEQQPDLLSDSGSSMTAEASLITSISADIIIAHLHGTELVLSASTLLLRSLPIGDVRELVVDYGVHSVTLAWWWNIADLMPSLNTVVLHGHNASDSFFDVLAFSLAPLGATGQVQEAPPLLQNVRNVSINGVDFAYPPRCTQAARALRRLERVQRRVRKLCLRACNIPRARVLELQAHVEVMTLDERGRQADPEGPLAWSSAIQDFYLSL